MRSLSIAICLALACLTAREALSAPAQMRIGLTGYTNKTEVLTNFPVLVVFTNNVSGSGFTYSDFVTATGYDLRFGTNSTPPATGLNYDIDTWNTGGASYVWVQVPTIPGDGSGAIWANWGDASASNQLPCTTNGATWSQSFSSVWHLGQTNAVPDLRDWTSYRRDGGSTGATSAAGIIGYGVDFESTENDVVSIPTGLGSDYVPSSNSPVTVSCWVNPETIAAAAQGNRALTIHDATSPSSGYFLSLGGNNKLYGFIDGGTVGGGSLTITSALTIATATWCYGSLTYNGNIGVLYQNGVEVGRTSAGAKLNAGAAYPAKLGNVDFSTAVFYDGLMDEARYSSIARSTNWVWAEYQTMAANTTFSSYGAMTSGGGASPRSFYRPNKIMRPNRAIKNQESAQ